jgi:hypothetical protein
LQGRRGKRTKEHWALFFCLQKKKEPSFVLTVRHLENLADPVTIVVSNWGCHFAVSPGWAAEASSNLRVFFFLILQVIQQTLLALEPNSPKWSHIWGLGSKRFGIQPP